MTGKPYSIHPRSTKSGKKVYYVQFRNPDGSWSNAKSTGEVSLRSAEAWAINTLVEHKENPLLLKGLDIQFSTYTKGFFDFDSSWATDKKSRGLRISERHCLERTIFIPQVLCQELAFLMEQHPFPNPDAFIFFSDELKDNPCVQRVFSDSLYKALHEIGIDETQRKERNITFHSWRHFLNSLMINAKIPIQKIQQITGHFTSDMVQHYYHLDDMSDMREIQEDVWG